MRGRKEGRVGAGGSGAEASCPKGFRIPGGAAALGLFLLGQDPAEMEQWRSVPAAPTRMPQVGPAEASCPPQDPRAAATTQADSSLGFFAGSGPMVRVWSLGGLHPLPETAQQPGVCWGAGVAAALPSSGTHVSRALD